MRKKVIFLIISALMCQNFIACSNSSSKSTQSSPSSESTSKDSAKSDDSSKDTKDEKKDTTLNNDTSKKEDNLSENNSSVTEKDVRIFYYDIESDKIIYQNKKIKVTYGALTNAIIDAYKGALDNQCYSGLPDNVVVKSAKLEKDKDLITVNFGDTFVNTLGYGAGIEASILQSVVNSLGYNFGVSNVYITVNGKPYSSGHIAQKENESFAVKYDGCVEK